MGYNSIPLRLHRSTSTLDSLSLLAKTSVQISQHSDHSVIHGLALCRYQLRHRHVFRPGIPRTVVAEKVPSTPVYQVYNYILSAALDGGTQVMVFILTSAVFGGSGKARPFP